jgi:quinol monooxygenase YgiN
MLDYTGLRNGLVVTAFWKAKPDETEAVAAILQRFMPQAQQEPGVRAFMIHQSKSEPSEFFFYEVFENEDAFAAHQQTPHFKALIAGEALPKLVKRESPIRAALSVRAAMAWTMTLIAPAIAAGRAGGSPINRQRSRR